MKGVTAATNASPASSAVPPAPAISFTSVNIRFAVATLLFGAILFGSAGRFALPAFWLYLALFFVFWAAAMFGVFRKDPELLAERLRRGSGDQDRASRPLLGLLFLTHWVLAGLDVGRFRWTGEIHLGLHATAFVTLALGLAGWIWPMSVNRFFSAQVRLQSERGHTVIDRGPYRIVRHPGYASFLLLLLSGPVALGSYVSGIPAAAMAVVVIARTALEDRFLHANLPGYREYASRVRYRLIPFIW